MEEFEKHPGHAILYKSDTWTTNEAFPVLESWFIAAPPGHRFLKRCDITFRRLLEEGSEKSLERLTADTSVDYQRFLGRHGDYHLCYFMMLYLQQTGRADPILALPCPPDQPTCMYLMSYNNQHTMRTLLEDALSSDDVDKIRASSRMIKLAGYNRRYMEEEGLRPAPGSLLDHLHFDLQAF